MAVKKATSVAAKPKAASASLHPAYKEMIRDAIIKLKERNGSSRSKLKQYIIANNKGLEANASFDSQFNKAIKSGVEKGDFAQPKGPSGTVKLAKKDASKPAPVKKTAAVKKAATVPKKAAATAVKKTKAAAAPKKAAAKPAAAKAAKPKSAANTGAKRKSKASAVAPAIVEEKKVSSKTKSGRVTKGPAKPVAPKKKAAAPKKKAATAKA